MKSDISSTKKQRDNPKTLKVTSFYTKHLKYLSDKMIEQDGEKGKRITCLT
uniref:Uncharacterized protein n=1 Tax=Rhizophora mucronata TaxID=61149 RepID=A0A2P2NC76_RHIMU